MCCLALGFSFGVDGESREDIVMAYVASDSPLKVLMAKVYRERRVWGDPNMKKVNLLIPPPSPVWKVADSSVAFQ